jgi:hypothetical protein
MTSIAAATVELVPAAAMELVAAATVELVPTAVKLMSASREPLVAPVKTAIPSEPASLVTEAPVAVESVVATLEPAGTPVAVKSVEVAIPSESSIVSIEVVELSVSIKMPEVIVIKMPEVIVVEPVEPFTTREPSKSGPIPPPVKSWLVVVEAIPRTHSDEHSVDKVFRSPVTIRRAIERIVIVIPVWTRRRSVVEPISRADLHTNRHLSLRMGLRAA